MKTAITLTLRAFPVTIQDTHTGQTAEDRIIFTKEQLRAAALVGQSSKELISRMYNREGYKVLAIGRKHLIQQGYDSPLAVTAVVHQGQTVAAQLTHGYDHFV